MTIARWTVQQDFADVVREVREALDNDGPLPEKQARQFWLSVYPVKSMHHFCEMKN
jgi:hypothetical protein